MNKIHWVWMAVAMMVWWCTGCGNGGRVDPRLAAIDSIVDRDSVAAWQQLQAIDSAALTTEADRALYALLHQQLRYKQYLPLDTTVLQSLLGYFSNHDRHDTHPLKVRTMILMGASREDAGNADDAMDLYLQAIEEADTADYRNLGQANMRVGVLLNQHFAKQITAEPYFEKAYHYFTLTGDTPHQGTALATLASIYRVTKHERAHATLEQASQLTLEGGDTAEYVACREALARCLYEDSLPSQSLQVTKEFMLAMPQKWITANNYYDLARAYATMGSPDSARYYLSKVPEDIAPYHRYFRVACLERIARAEGNNDEAYRLAKIASRLADSISSNPDLLHIMRQTTMSNEKNEAVRRDTERVLSNKTMHLSWGIVFVVIAACVAIGVIKWRNHYRLLNFQSQMRASHKSMLQEIDKKEKQLMLMREALDRKLLDATQNNSKEHSDEEVDKLRTQLNFHREFTTAYLSSFQSLLKASHDNSPTQFAHSFSTFMKQFHDNNKFWHGLRDYIDACHDNASSRLRRQYPELRENDYRIMDLMMADFSYVEIATLMGISSNSVTKQRTRIARRMDIQGSLTDFIDALREAR